jgi:cytolysin (calcineurin-like family phosphatase)
MSQIMVRSTFKKTAVIKLLSVLSIFLILSSCSIRATYFLVTSDLHFDGTTDKMAILDSVVADMNSIPNTHLPDGSGKMQKPFGVIVTGDITDGGKPEQWQQYKELFGLNGDQRLKYQLFESFGNHDGNIEGTVRTGIAERNDHRKNLKSVSANGLHYSWDRDGIHFVMLGAYPGNVWDSTCGWCHYFKESFRDPQASLDFLKHDFEMNVKNSDQPVILFFHYGWDDFGNLWWTPAEQEAFYRVIKDNNIVAIFHGHDHATANYTWRGIKVWSAGSPQRGQQTGNYLIVKVVNGTVSVFDRYKGQTSLIKE